jgi:hypothetical protein
MSPQLGRVSVKSALVPPRGTFYDTFALGFRIENRFFDPRLLPREPRGVSCVRAYARSTGSKFSHRRGKFAPIENRQSANNGEESRDD